MTASNFSLYDEDDCGSDSKQDDFLPVHRDIKIPKPLSYDLTQVSDEDFIKFVNQCWALDSSQLTGVIVSYLHMCMPPEVNKNDYSKFLYSKLRDLLLAYQTNPLRKMREHVFGVMDMRSGAKCDDILKGIVNKNLLELSKQAAEEKITQPLFSSVGFFTHVYEDGFGDLVHCCLTACLFKKIWPDLPVLVVVFIKGSRAESANKVVSSLLDKLNIPKHILVDCFPNASDQIDREVKITYNPLLLEQALSSINDNRQLNKIEAVIEISSRVPNLSDVLNKLEIYPKCFMFWGEASLPLLSYFPTSPILYKSEALFKKLSDVSTYNLRLGCELAIRFETQIKAYEDAITRETFNDTIKRLESKELINILQNNSGAESHLYMGYLREQVSLYRFCKLLRELHDEPNQVVNVFVKRFVNERQIKKLRMIFSRVECHENDVKRNADIQLKAGDDRPILRLISLPVSYSDTNLIIAMSRVGGGGGDNIYFQLLSSSLCLPFMERMKHDFDFIPYLKHILSNIQDTYPEFYTYFNVVDDLTNNNKPKDKSTEDRYILVIADLIKNKRERLLEGFQKFTKILREKHNMETIVKGMAKWHERNVWSNTDPSFFYPTKHIRRNVEFIKLVNEDRREKLFSESLSLLLYSSDIGASSVCDVSKFGMSLFAQKPPERIDSATTQCMYALLS